MTRWRRYWLYISTSFLRLHLSKVYLHSQHNISEVSEQRPLRDAVLVKGVYIVAVFVSGLLVQVAKVLHG